jgi:hypothetical protein
MTWVLVAGAALVPALVMWSVAPPQRRRARAWWLMGLVLVMAAVLGTLEPWLAVVAVALLVWWVQPSDDFIGQLGGAELLPVIGSWLAIAATWFLVRVIPAADLPWLLLAWGALGYAQVGFMVWQRWRPWVLNRAPFGGFGQRMYAGCFLALLCCLLPLWAWPGLLVGLWLSGPSWLACLALVAGSAVRWPWAMPYMGIALLGAILAITGERWIKRRRVARGLWGYYPLDRLTPRGNTLVTVVTRLRVARLTVRDLLRSPSAWLIGFGPGTSGRASRRWNLTIQARDARHARGRGRGVEALGNFHSEPIQVVYEFGAVGVLGLGLFAWRVGSGMAWGDPWSAAAVAAMVMACGGNVSGIIPLGVTCLIVWARVAP